MGDLLYNNIPVIISKKKSMMAEEKRGIHSLEGSKNMRFIVKGGGERCEFILKDFSRKDFAKLRRIIMSSLKTMAIHKVNVFQNTSGFFDEDILQRLGLIPIRCTDVEDIPTIVEDSQSGIWFDMDLKNNTQSKKVIKAKDINLQDKRCHVTKPNIPIFYLRPGQRFEIRGLVQKGTARMHNKWSPVSAVRFENDERSGEYILKLETLGQLTCREIFTRALRIFEE